MTRHKNVGQFPFLSVLGKPKDRILQIDFVPRSLVCEAEGATRQITSHKSLKHRGVQITWAKFCPMQLCGPSINGNQV